MSYAHLLHLLTVCRCLLQGLFYSLRLLAMIGQLSLHLIVLLLRAACPLDGMLCLLLLGLALRDELSIELPQQGELILQGVICLKRTCHLSFAMHCKS